eukprot:6132323-Prymnesium_polylepis.1
MEVLRRSGSVPPPKRVHVGKQAQMVKYRFGNWLTELPNASGSAGGHTGRGTAASRCTVCITRGHG